MTIGAVVHKLVRFAEIKYAKGVPYIMTDDKVRDDTIDLSLFEGAIRHVIQAETGMTDEEYDKAFEEWNEARMRIYHDEPRKSVFEGLGRVVSLNDE
jgi:hypothetical protein